jgi:hypothetical protein
MHLSWNLGICTALVLLILCETVASDRIRLRSPLSRTKVLHVGSFSGDASMLLSSRQETVIEGEGLVITPGKGGKPSVISEAGAEDAESDAETAGETTTENGRTVIEGEGIVLSPVTANPSAGGKETAAGAEGETKKPQTVNINGVPFQVSGSEISINGKPLEEASEEGTTAAPTTNTPAGKPLEVAGSDILLDGKPIESEAKKGNGTTKGVVVNPAETRTDELLLRGRRKRSLRFR